PVRHGTGLRRPRPRALDAADVPRAARSRRSARLMAPPGLGRGLDVLLGQSGSPVRAPAEHPSTNEIPLELVRPNRHQPRTAFDPEGLSELAGSISRHGVLQPIVVSIDGDGYELVAGHRRVLAARLAGRPTI